MNIEKLQKLENVIAQKDYEKANRSKGSLWNGVGYFMQFVNILICLLGMLSLLTAAFGAFAASTYLYIAISTGILMGWELLKRNTVTDITFGVMRTKKFSKNLLGGVLLSLILLVGSGYLAINGIQEITDKTSEVEEVTFNNSQAVIDSLNISYGAQINQLEDRVDFYYSQAQSKERALTLRESKQVADIETKIKGLKDELGLKVTNIKNDSEAKLSATKEDIGSRVLTFLVVTITIELFIALALVKTAVINFNSYMFKVNTQEYKAFNLNAKLLAIFYNDGKYRDGDECPSMTKFEDLVKLKNINISKSEVTLFLTLLKAKDIITVISNKRRFSKSYEEALSDVKDYYGFN